MRKNSSVYLRSPQSRTPRKRFAPVQAMVSLLLASVFLFVGIFSTVQSHQPATQAQAFNVDRWAACLFGDDSIPGFMYNVTQTDKMNFDLRSKSAMTSGISDVEGFLNSVISMFGHDFKEINEGILGTSLDPLNPNEDLEESDLDPEEIFNQGARVNPFDRFGVAGLNFTSYTGEWRYVIVDACNPGNPQDPEAGVFYEGRLEPQSTWDDITNSADVRTQQFDKGFVSQFGTSFVNVIANWIFVITKFIVVFTIALVSFSFTDIVGILGLSDFLAGENADTGLFGMLYSGMFLPLIVIAFAITGIYIFIQAFFKRQFRKSMGALIRSIVLFVVAIIISASPAFWTSVPNNVATVLQSFVITSLNSGIAGGSGICETDVANARIITDESAEPAGLLEQASKNMSSSINCQFWQTFLLTPWAQGQWGTEWENTYAADTEVDLPNMSDYDYLSNTNGDMVGDAPVPVGNDEFIHNWAIFNISTNTNAHAPVDLPGERSKVTNGVANDWYRIVDAVANYQEETVEVVNSIDIPDSVILQDNDDIEYAQPMNVPVTEEWNAWTGNESNSRMWTAASSVVIAAIGLAPPLVFSFLSAVFSIGVSLLAALAPLFLLLGVWADRGWRIFLSWLELLLNTVIARVVLGGLIALSVTLTMAAIRMMDNVGWWQGMLLLTILSLVIIRSRRQIMNAVKITQMGVADLAATSRRVMDRTTGAAKGVGRVGVSAVGGGIAARRYGGSFGQGAKTALRTEFKNQMYRHPATHRAMGQYEEVKMHTSGPEGTGFFGHNVCAGCGGDLQAVPDRYGTPIFHGGRDDNGNLYCTQCFNDGIRDDLREVTIEVPEGKIPESERWYPDTSNNEAEKIVQGRFDKNISTFNQNSAQNFIERISKKVDKHGNGIDNKQNVDQLKALLKFVNYDIVKHQSKSGRGKNVYPQPPQEIASYLPVDETAAAWRTGNYDYIRAAYTLAWANWYHDVTGDTVRHKLDELIAYVEHEASGKQEIDPDRKDRDNEDEDREDRQA